MEGVQDTPDQQSSEGLTPPELMLQAWRRTVDPFGILPPSWKRRWRG